MTEYQLSKRIAAYTKTIRFRWCKRDFMEMSPQYREIRRGMGDTLIICFWCRHKFVDGEMMALASREKAGNVVLCQECAGAMLDSTP